MKKLLFLSLFPLVLFGQSRTFRGNSQAEVVIVVDSLRIVHNVGGGVFFMADASPRVWQCSVTDIEVNKNGEDLTVEVIDRAVFYVKTGKTRVNGTQVTEGNYIQLLGGITFGGLTGGGGSSDWFMVADKPFTYLGSGFSVSGDTLYGNGGGGSGTWEALEGKPFNGIGANLTVDNNNLTTGDNIPTKDGGNTWTGSNSFKGLYATGTTIVTGDIFFRPDAGKRVEIKNVDTLTASPTHVIDDPLDFVTKAYVDSVAAGGGGSTVWDSISGKPFSSIGDYLTVSNNELTVGSEIAKLGANSQYWGGGNTYGDGGGIIISEDGFFWARGNADFNGDVRIGYTGEHTAVELYNVDTLTASPTHVIDDPLDFVTKQYVDSIAGGGTGDVTEQQLADTATFIRAWASVEFQPVGDYATHSDIGDTATAVRNWVNEGFFSLDSTHFNDVYSNNIFKGTNYFDGPVGLKQGVVFDGPVVTFDVFDEWPYGIVEFGENNRVTIKRSPVDSMDATNKKYVDELVGSVEGVSFVVVDSLPATGVTNVIYLLKVGDKYDEYVWVVSENKFEGIGNTDIDLSGYVTKSMLGDTVSTIKAWAGNTFQPKGTYATLTNISDTATAAKTWATSSFQGKGTYASLGSNTFTGSQHLNSSLTVKGTTTLGDATTDIITANAPIRMYAGYTPTNAQDVATKAYVDAVLANRSNSLRGVRAGSNAWEWVINSSIGNNYLPSVAYGAGVFMAAGNSNSYPYDVRVVSRNFGRRWDAFYGGVRSFRGIAYGGGMWMMVDRASYIFRSWDDGVSWTQTEYGNYQEFVDNFYNKGTWLAIIKGGIVIRSTDEGGTWTSQDLGNYEWSSIAGNGNPAVIVGAGGNIARSANGGISWTVQNNGTHNWKGIDYGEGVWIAVDDSGYVARSADNGVTWTMQDLGDYAWNGAAYGEGSTWVLCGSGGNVAHSADNGVTWTVQDLGDQTWLGVAYGADVWALSSSNGAMAYTGEPIPASGVVTKQYVDNLAKKLNAVSDQPEKE